jgi:hypothetical protein
MSHLSSLVSIDWVLGLLAGMKFPEQDQAYNFVKKAYDATRDIKDAKSQSFAELEKRDPRKVYKRIGKTTWVLCDNEIWNADLTTASALILPEEEAIRMIEKFVRVDPTTDEEFWFE